MCDTRLHYSLYNVCFIKLCTVSNEQCNTLHFSTLHYTFYNAHFIRHCVVSKEPSSPAILYSHSDILGHWRVSLGGQINIFRTSTLHYTKLYYATLHYTAPWYIIRASLIDLRWLLITPLAQGSRVVHSAVQCKCKNKPSFLYTPLTAGCVHSKLT